LKKPSCLDSPILFTQQRGYQKKRLGSGSYR